ncbi:MAG: hypothetical protein ACXU8S_02195 [Phenylobacterium sp.]
MDLKMSPDKMLAERGLTPSIPSALDARAPMKRSLAVDDLELVG